MKGKKDTVYYSIRVVNAKDQKDAIRKIELAKFADNNPFCDKVLTGAELLTELNKKHKPNRIYFIFGEQACKDIDVITERKFINRYGSNGTESCYPFEYIEGKTTAPDLLHAMNGSFDFSIISERLYKLLTK